LKRFTPEVILHSDDKHTNEEAYREEHIYLDLSMCELELFVAIQYVRRLTYVIFHTTKVAIFSYFQKTYYMLANAILNYLSFLGQEQTNAQQYVLFSRH